MRSGWNAALTVLFCAGASLAQEFPANRWVELSRDPLGGRRGSAIRYADAAGQFILWGFMTPDMQLPQENPLMEIPEYDVVAFDPAARRWANHFPPHMEREWSRKLPLASVPRTYSALTTGSERILMRGSTEDEPGVPRPDLNIVFDQVAYRPGNNSLYYFTGGLTAQYDVTRRRWRDLRPPHSPPPVTGGSLAYDPLHDEFVLFGGGHIAEDVFLTLGAGLWEYSPSKNAWRKSTIADPALRAGQNRAMVYEAKRDLILLVLGGSGNEGRASVFALRYRP